MEKIIETVSINWGPILLLFVLVIIGVKYLIKGRNIQGYVKTPVFELTLTTQHNETMITLKLIKEQITDTQKEVWRQIIHSEFIPIEERLILAQNYSNAGYNGLTLEYVKQYLLKRKNDNI